MKDEDWMYLHEHEILEEIKKLEGNKELLKIVREFFTILDKNLSDIDEALSGLDLAWGELWKENKRKFDKYVR